MNDRDERVRGDLDNEMADAVRELVALQYSGRGTSRRPKRLTNTRYAFAVSQDAARKRGVLVPRFWWRKETNAALERFTGRHPSELVSLGDLADAGLLEVYEGHGSPPGHSCRTGDIPYVKVTDLKNWRINENPTNFISKAIADRLRRRGPELRYGDLVTPSRASSNIGQYCLVLPWQTPLCQCSVRRLFSLKY